MGFGFEKRPEKRSRGYNPSSNLLPQDQAAPISLKTPADRNSSSNINSTSSSLNTPGCRGKTRQLKRLAKTPEEGATNDISAVLPIKGMEGTKNDAQVQVAIKERCKVYNRRIRTLVEAMRVAAGQPKKSWTDAESEQFHLRHQVVRAIFEPKLRFAETYYNPRAAFQTLLCGNNESSQLSLLHGKQKVDSEDCNTFTCSKTLQNYPITQVACGGLHSLALHFDGRTVFSWGVNDTGALGRISAKNSAPEYDPLPVDFPPETGIIVKIAAGDYISMALTLDGNLWSWGVYKDAEGKRFCDVEELGPDSYKHVKGSELISGQKTRFRPTQVHLPPDTFIEDVWCGLDFVAARTSEGELLTWGCNFKGEIGRPTKQMRNADGEYDNEAVLKEWLTPRPPLWNGGVSRKVQTVACGGFHMLVVAMAGQGGCATTTVFSCGLNNYGQLGLGDDGIDTDRHELTKIEAFDDVSVQKVAAGEHFSLCCDDNGFLYAFGRGDRLQLGIHNESEDGKKFLTDAGFFVNRPVRVPLAEKVVDMACGTNYCVAKTTSGNLYSWGCGESGQLGLRNDEDVCRPRKVHLDKSFDFLGEKLDIEVVSMACGGQHTAISCAIARKAEK